MRILLVSSLERGGPVEQSLMLAGALARAGAQVGVACASEAVAARFAAAGAETVVAPLSPGLDLAGGARLARLARGFDVVNAQDRRAGLWVRLAPRSRAVRVYTVRGMPDPYLPAPVGSARVGLRDRLAYELVEPALCRRVDGVVVPSEAMAKLLRDRLRFPSAKLNVIPNGVDLEEPVGRGALIGTVSAVEPVKAIDVFVRAAAELAERRPGERFAVFGDGSLAPAIAAQARGLGLNGRLALRGHVPAAEALGQLAVFVLCSYFENCPVGLLQAMAAGVPVVVTRVGGVPEIVDEDTARLVDPGDASALARAIGELLDDPALGRRQAQAARHRIAERFSVDATATKTIALYRQLLEARGAPA